MSQINSYLLNLLPNIFSWKGSSSKELQLEKSENEPKKNYCSPQDLSSISMEKDRVVGLKASLRYKVLCSNFITKNSHKNIIYFYDISDKLNNVFSDLEIRAGRVNLLVEKGLYEFYEIYSDEIQSIAESGKRRAANRCATLNMLSIINHWYAETVSKLSDFNKELEQLKLSAFEKINFIKNNLNNKFFDENSYDLLNQEIDSIKKEYCLDEFLKKWELSYRAICSSLGQHQIELNCARMSQLQRSVIAQRLSLQ